MLPSVQVLREVHSILEEAFLSPTTPCTTSKMVGSQQLMLLFSASDWLQCRRLEWSTYSAPHASPTLFACILPALFLLPPFGRVAMLTQLHNTFSLQARAASSDSESGLAHGAAM